MSKLIFLLISIVLTGCAAEKTAPLSTFVPVQTSASVPLPQKEDIIRTFFNLINEKRVTEAINMLSVPNKDWEGQLNSFEKISVKSIEPSSENNYKVILSVTMKPKAQNALIPNYGFENGENMRWVGLEKDSSGLWKITGIATGP